MDLHPHKKQSEVIRLIFTLGVQFVDMLCGRRSGKTELMAIITCMALFLGWKVIYTSPSTDQLVPFWNYIVKKLSYLPIRTTNANGVRVLTLPGHNFGELRARTAANPDHLRGFEFDLCLVDEMQNQPATLYEDVLLPMTLDGGGRIVTAMTPPNLLATKNVANLQAAKAFYKKYIQSGLHDSFTWTTWDNPHIPRENIQKLKDTMDPIVYDREVLGKLLEQAPGALWTREDLHRMECPPRSELLDIVIAVDPAYGVDSDETGMMVVGLTNDYKGLLLHDASGHYPPNAWGAKLMELCELYKTRTIPVESNYMAALIHDNIQASAEAAYVDSLNIVPIYAKESKAQRAFPVSTLYRKERVFHVEGGEFEALEDQMCLWEPHRYNRERGGSPDRIDALVHGVRYLMIDSGLMAVTVDDVLDDADKLVAV